MKTVEDTEYDELCSDCQDELDLDRPQFHGMVTFKGNFKTPTCDKCGERLLP